MRLGYFLSCEEHGPRELVRQAKLAEEAGFHAPLDLRPLPPVERRAGPEPVRVVGHRRAGGGDGPPRDHRRHLPHHAHPPGRSWPRPPRRPRRCSGRAASPSASGPERRSTSTSSATRWPEADVRLEMLEEAIEIMRGMWEGGQYSIRARTTSWRTRASTRCPTSRRRSSSPASARRRSTWPARIGDGFCTVEPDADAIERFRDAGGGGQGRPRRHEGLLRRGRGGLPGHGAPPLAQRGPARRAAADPPDARALRAGLASW